MYTLLDRLDELPSKPCDRLRLVMLQISLANTTADAGSGGWHLERFQEW